MLRVVSAKGELVGVVSRKDALKHAQEAGLDLVEIAPKARPPVAKIIDFGKFRYAEMKKVRAAKKRTKAAEVKEVRFSPFIAEGDFQTRFARVREFLRGGNKVRIVVKFKGRQMNSKKFGYELMDKLLDELEQEVNVDMKPKFLGRHLAMVISPINRTIKKINDEKNKNEDQKEREQALQNNGNGQASAEAKFHRSPKRQALEPSEKTSLGD